MQNPAPASPQQLPETWTATAPGYKEIAEHMVPYAAEALRLAPVPAGGSVIDVASGPGPLAFLAAKTAARVVVVDFSEGMIAEVRARMEREGATNVEPFVMNALSLDFPDASFDVAACMFGFMFFPDRARAFREMARVLKPGGRAVVGTWAPVDKRPLMKVGFDAASEVGLPTPGKGDLQSPEDCVREMTEGGFRDVSVHTFNSSVFVDSAETYFRAIVAGGAPIVLMKKKLGAEAWSQIEGRFLDALRKRIPEGGCSLPAEALLTLGTR